MDNLELVRLIWSFKRNYFRSFFWVLPQYCRCGGSDETFTYVKWFFTELSCHFLYLQKYLFKLSQSSYIAQRSTSRITTQLKKKNVIFHESRWKCEDTHSDEIASHLKNVLQNYWISNAPYPKIVDISAGISLGVNISNICKEPSGKYWSSLLMRSSKKVFLKELNSGQFLPQ